MKPISRPLVAFAGATPPPALVRALHDQGVDVVNGAEASRAGADGVVASVAATIVIASGRRAPRAPGPGPWLWLADAPPTLVLQSVVVDHGCVDVIIASAADAAATIARRVRALAAPVLPIPEHDRMVANSVGGQRLLQQLAQAASTAQPVLLTGETGTGKDVAAHLIHDWSRRADKPFVPINCSAIPNELMEAELFGYARGAFSGAVKDFDGQLGAAAGGSVFLDEIDDTPLSLQMKLLRVLEDRVVTRLGESRQRRVDFRIIAATNRDLKGLVHAGDFGADLFERLAIVRIEMPPLRERLADLPALVAMLLRRFDDEEQRERERVTSTQPAALAALAAYGWPGNIRELRNVIFESLVYKNSGDELLLSDLPRRVLRAAQRGSNPDIDDTNDDRAGLADDELARRIASGTFDLREAMNDLEGRALREAMRLGGTPVAAARLLGTVGRGNARDPADTVRAMLRRHQQVVLD